MHFFDKRVNTEQCHEHRRKCISINDYNYKRVSKLEEKANLGSKFVSIELSSIYPKVGEIFAGVIFILGLLLIAFEHQNKKPTLTLANEVKYVGGQKNGKLNGQGTYTYSNGDKYVGEWGNGYPWGQGTMKHTNGDIYTGSFSGRKPNGQGVYTYANGDKYDGMFKDGKKNGQGTMTYLSGKTQTGKWKDDVFVG